MFTKGFEKTAKAYFIYRNVHKGKDKYVYSLRAKDTGRVEGHESELYLKDPRFAVGSSGRDRVKSTGVKNVHAGIHGEKIDTVPEGLSWQGITYDPKKHEGFVNRNTLAPVQGAGYAKLTPQGVFVAEKPVAPEHRELWEQSQKEFKRLKKIQDREKEKLERMGVPSLLPSGSSNSGLVVPGGKSDIDFVFGSHDVKKDSKILTELGIPLHKDRGTSRTHRYVTHEGVQVDVNIRHPNEVEHLRKHNPLIVNAPDHEKAEHIALKKYYLDRGDKAGYKKIKYLLPEKYGIIPKEGWEAIRNKK